MKHTKIFALMLALAVLLLSLTGCGTSGSTASGSYAVMEEAAAADYYDSGDGALTKSANTLSGDTEDSTVLPEGQKWIVTVYLSAETEDLDAFTQALNEKISALDGYLESQSVYNGSTYASSRYRSASLTVRIPAEQADSFTEDVAGIANLVSSEKNLEDVTLSYTTTENRVKALETEEARLLELMEQAETVSDLLEIEDQLTEVRYQLENYGSQLKLYDNQINYATIYLDVDEVQEYTPTEEPGVWERIRDGFQSSLEGVADGAVDCGVFLLANLPYLVVYAALIAVAVLVIRAILRRRKKKAPKAPTGPENTGETKQ